MPLFYSQCAPTHAPGVTDCASSVNSSICLTIVCHSKSSITEVLRLLQTMSSSNLHFRRSQTSCLQLPVFCVFGKCVASDSATLMFHGTTISLLTFHLSLATCHLPNRQFPWKSRSNCSRLGPLVSHLCDVFVRSFTPRVAKLNFMLCHFHTRSTFNRQLKRRTACIINRRVTFQFYTVFFCCY